MSDIITKPIRQAALLQHVNQWLQPATMTESDGLAPNDGGIFRESPAQSPLHLEKVLDDLGGDRELLARVLDEFLNRLRIQIITMREALASDNLEVIQRESHAIKGGAGNIYAAGLYKIAQELNETERPVDTIRVSELLVRLEKEFQVLESFVSIQFPRQPGMV